MLVNGMKKWRQYAKTYVLSPGIKDERSGERDLDLHWPLKLNVHWHDRDMTCSTATAQQKVSTAAVVSQGRGRKLCEMEEGGGRGRHVNSATWGGRGGGPLFFIIIIRRKNLVCMRDGNLSELER